MTLGRIPWGRRITRFCKISLALCLLLMMGGCEYLFRQSEIMSACSEQFGGTRASCDRYNRMNQTWTPRPDPTIPDPSFIADSKKKAALTNPKVYAQWRDHIQQTIGDEKTSSPPSPELAWLNGIWCRPDFKGGRERFKLVGPDNLIRTLFYPSRSEANGYVIAASLHGYKDKVKKQADYYVWTQEFNHWTDSKTQKKYPEYLIQHIRKDNTNQFTIFWKIRTKNGVKQKGYVAKTDPMNSRVRCTQDQARKYLKTKPVRKATLKQLQSDNKLRAQWANHIQEALRDEKAISANQPGLSWLNGIWCSSQSWVQRIQIRGTNQLLRTTFHDGEVGRNYNSPVRINQMKGTWKDLGTKRYSGITMDIGSRQSTDPNAWKSPPFFSANYIKIEKMDHNAYVSYSQYLINKKGEKVPSKGEIKFHRCTQSQVKKYVMK